MDVASWISTGAAFVSIRGGAFADYQANLSKIAKAEAVEERGSSSSPHHLDTENAHPDAGNPSAYAQHAPIGWAASTATSPDAASSTRHFGW